MSATTVQEDHRAAHINAPGVPTSSTVNKSSVDVIGKCVKTVMLVFELSGYEKEGRDEVALANCAAHSMKCIEKMGGKWMAYFKYKIAAFYASVRQQDMPPLPEGLEQGDDDPRVLIGGNVRKWFVGLIRGPEGYKKQCAIALSILESKRGFPRASEDDLVAAAVESFETLTRKTEDPSPREGVNWGDSEENEVQTSINKENLKFWITKVVEETYGGKEYTVEDTMEPMFPSTKANYNNTRSKAGTVGEIMNHPWILRGLKSDNLVKAKIVQSGKHSNYVLVDRSELNSKWKELYGRVLTAALVEEPVAIPVALAEALKIRVISKGPPMTYLALKPLQKWLWRQLYEHDSGVFQLIGKEVNDELVSKAVGKCREGEGYLSGDYKAATDNLRSWISDFIAEEIARVTKMDEDTAELLKRALTGHIIEHPVTGETRPQLQGQLMGSIVSFPILCIANAAICLWTRSVSVGRNLTLKTANMLVNGDDLILRARLIAKSFWERLAAFSGMKPSIGKCYYSPEFLHINSAEFTVVEETADRRSNPKKPILSHLNRVRYINLGLVLGLKRSTKGTMDVNGVTDWGSYQSMSVNAQELKLTCPTTDWKRVYAYYLSYNEKKLKGTSLSWFLPEHLGGLGLPMDAQHQPSKKDLRIAAVIYNNYELPRERLNVPWKVWQYATMRAKSILKTQTLSAAMSEMGTGQNLKDENKLLALFCVESIFSQRLKDIFDESESNSKMLDKMEKIWKKASKNELMEKTEAFNASSLPTKARIEAQSQFLNISTRYEDVPAGIIGFGHLAPDERKTSSVARGWGKNHPGSYERNSIPEETNSRWFVKTGFTHSQSGAVTDSTANGVREGECSN